jgi:short-subunit dehydrogenase
MVKPLATGYAATPMPRKLTGKVMVITGASSGIGAATALACARAGMDLVLNARRAEPLEAVAGEARKLGRGVELVIGDVTDAGMSARLLDAAERRFGRFDVVFANAGYGLNKPLHELDDAALRRIFDVNFFAASDLLREAARRLIAARRRGHLLMCSSSIAKFTLPTFAAYSATKAAQHHVCQAMRIELKSYGIDVSSVHPITTETGFSAVAAELSGQPPGAMSPADQLPRWLRQTPEVVADAIVRCLRRPTPEVWTSTIVRILAPILSAFPRCLDLAAGIRQRR